MAESTFKFANASESLEVDQYRTITVASALGTPTYSIEGSTATINTSTGKVTGTAAGAAVTVTASRDAGGTTTDGYLAKTATYQLTVSAGTALTISGPTSVMTFTNTAGYSTAGGSPESVTYSVKTSPAEGRAYMNGTSLGSGVKTGSVVIEAKKAASTDPDNGWLEQTAEMTVTVNANDRKGIAIKSDGKIYMNSELTTSVGEILSTFNNIYSGQGQSYIIINTHSAWVDPMTTYSAGDPVWVYTGSYADTGHKFPTTPTDDKDAYVVLR